MIREMLTIPRKEVGETLELTLVRLLDGLRRLKAQPNLRERAYPRRSRVGIGLSGELHVGREDVTDLAGTDRLEPFATIRKTVGPIEDRQRQRVQGLNLETGMVGRTIAHLFACSGVERHKEKGIGRHSGVEHVSGALSQDPGLARTRGSDDARPGRRIRHREKLVRGERRRWRVRDDGRS